MTLAPNLSERAAAERSQRNQRMTTVDFNLSPFTIAWEVSRACAYACVHCRADAIHKRDPQELTTEEAKKLIDDLTGFGSPILIFTGGDPMMRPDLAELIAYANKSGLRCSLTPTATALPTKKRLEEVRDAGIRRIALSLDAPRPEVHDGAGRDRYPHVCKRCAHERGGFNEISLVCRDVDKAFLVLRLHDGRKRKLLCAQIRERIVG